MLSISSVLSFAQTCKELYEILPRMIPNMEITVQARARGFQNWKFHFLVRHLTVIGEEWAEYDLGSLPPRLEFLKVVDIPNAHIEGFNCVNLKEVVFDHCYWITDEFLGKLPNGLVKLCIMECGSEISNRAWANMQRMNGLKELLIPNPRFLSDFINDEGVKCLQFMAKLTVLDLSASEITDATIPLINTLKLLRELNLADCVDITALGFELLKGLALESLNLSGTNVTDKGVLPLLRSCRGTLRHLNLEWCTGITGEAFASVNLQFLKDLNLGNCNIDGKYCTSFKKWPLRNLDLYDCRSMTDEWIAFLPKSLVKLILYRCIKLTDEAMRSLRRMQSLRVLNLLGCEQMTDQGIALLPKSLVKLDLHGCIKLTDNAMRALWEMKSLRCLDLTRCNKITDSGIALIPRGLTNLNLSFLSNITKGCVPSLLEMKDLKFIAISGTKVPVMPIKERFEKQVRFYMPLN